jgi:hypothetical protein
LQQSPHTDCRPTISFANVGAGRKNTGSDAAPADNSALLRAEGKFDFGPVQTGLDDLRPPTLQPIRNIHLSSRTSVRYVKEVA